MSTHVPTVMSQKILAWLGLALEKENLCRQAMAKEFVFSLVRQYAVTKK